MLDFLKICGICGLLSLVSTFALLVAGIAAACLSKSRRALITFAVIALLPLLIGLLGTAAGYHRVSRAGERINSPEPALIQHGREQARYTTYLGLGCTGLLWVIVVVAASLKKQIQDPEFDSPNAP